MRERLYKTVKKYAIFLGIGLAYFIFVAFSGVKIPCVFHRITGLKCPGCGITRMLIALANFQFAKAYAFNPFLFVNLPILLLCIGILDIRYIKTGTRSLGKWSIVLWAEIVLFLAFGIIRNIVGI